MRSFIHGLSILCLVAFVTACGGGGGGGTSVPSAPLNVTATPGDTTVGLTWDAVAGASGYKVYWHDGGVTTADWTLLESPLMTTASHSGLTNEITYSYRVSAVNSGGEGAFSSTVTATPFFPLVAPLDVTATPGDTTVGLTWDAVAGASSYSVYWHDGGVTTANWTLLSTQSARSATHSSLTNDVTYSYRVNALISGVEGPFSATVSTTPRIAPTAPAHLRSEITADSATATQVTISWPAVVNATSYRVYFGTKPGIVTASASLNVTATTSYSVTLDSSNNRHVARVAAVNDEVEGPLSAEIAVSTQGGWGMRSGAHGVADILGMAHDSTSGIYVNVGERGLVSRSTDGVKWSMINAGASEYNFMDVIWAGDKFVAVGWDALHSQIAVLNSSDGLLWTTTVGQITAIDTPSYLSLAWSGTDLLLVGSGFYAHTDSTLNVWTKSTTMVPAGGGAPISTIGRRFNDAMWDGSQFLISDAGNIFLSSDLTTWNISNTNLFALDVVNNAIYVAAALDGIYSSSDGVTWTLRQAVPAGAGDFFYFTGAVWDAFNSQFVVMGVDAYTANSGRIYTSADGISWVETATGLSKTLNGLFNAGNQSIVYGDNGVFLVSHGGTTWSAIEGHGGENIQGPASDGSGWVVVGNKGVVGRSTDGVSWNWLNRMCSTWTTGTNWLRVAYGNNKYVAVGQQGCIMGSTDGGATWTEVTSGVTADLYDIEWDGAQFVAVGNLGTILT
ncbi:MAG: fibronectin type III domain-containing protein, partial [Chromatiales bacterium]|nr:fibronectin type III domain-containing protein [Chromatiales bacterium]